MSCCSTKKSVAPIEKYFDKTVTPNAHATDMGYTRDIITLNNQLEGLDTYVVTPVSYGGVIPMVHEDDWWNHVVPALKEYGYIGSSVMPSLDLTFTNTVSGEEKTFKDSNYRCFYTHFDPLTKQPTAIVYGRYNIDDYPVENGEKGLFMITFSGRLEQLNHLKSILDKIKVYGKEDVDGRKSAVAWVTPDGHGGFDRHVIEISPSDYFDDSFYPSITKKFNKPVKEFIEDYLNSDESVLILMGYKGSGKTELVRQIINQAEGEATVTFDPDIMCDSKFYLDFFEGRSDLLVIEDADLFLQARTEGNPIMSLFLNLTDGILSATNKKFIFTTNLSTIDDIDSALVRHGRCFAVVDFQQLNEEEAKDVCEYLGIEYDDSMNSLADCFAKRKEKALDNGSRKKAKPSFGFGGGLVESMDSTFR